MNYFPIICIILVLQATLEMDRLFTLTSFKSELCQDYFPPIELDKDGTYALALYNLSTYNSIPNIIINQNDSFVYFIPSQRENKKRVIKIPEGAYEIETLEKFLYDIIFKEHVEFFKGGFFAKDQFKFSMKPNISTQKVEILASFQIDFKSNKNHIGNILGFDDVIIPENHLTTSNSLVKISNVDVVNVECNIISGSYMNGEPSHTLFSFNPNMVPPGYKISLYPPNMLFLPVNIKQLSNITLRLTDQDNQLVNFRGEQIVVQLNLRKIN